MTVDVSVPASPRVFDYIKRGKDNFASDRKLGEDLLTACPTLPQWEIQAHNFETTHIRDLAAHKGITQFAHLGCGLPVQPPPHVIANGDDGEDKANRDTTTVYVERDAVTLVHLRAIYDPTNTLEADLRDPEATLATIETKLDPKKPTAYFLIFVAEELEDSDLRAFLLALADRAAPGSYLVLTNLTPTRDHGVQNAVEAWNATDLPDLNLRTADDLAEIMKGGRFALFPPKDGAPPIAPVTDWATDRIPPPPAPVLGLVARLGRAA